MELHCSSEQQVCSVLQQSSSSKLPCYGYLKKRKKKRRGGGQVINCYLQQILILLKVTEPSNIWNNKRVS